MAEALNSSKILKERIRKQKERENKPRASRFTIEFPGTPDDKAELVTKITKVKQMMGAAGLSNFQVLTRLVEEWLHHNDGQCSMETDECNHQHPQFLQSSNYMSTMKHEVNEEMFVTTPKMIINLSQRSGQHAVLCKNPLGISELEIKGHCAIATLKCSGGHSFTWDSSPYMPNGKFLANVRMAHAFHVSGVLPSQYERLMDSAGIGRLPRYYTDPYFRGVYEECVEEERQEEYQAAVTEEAFLSEDIGDGIDIISDASHSVRRNASQTNVIVIGLKTHKVIHDELISKKDDLCTQRHERLGIERAFDHFAKWNGGVNIRTLCHDRNMSVNKYIREQQPEVRNQNDTWHAGKSLQKKLNSVCSGRQSDQGKSWHWELSDKVASIRTHVHWCIRNCEGNAQNLRDRIDNIISHYQNQHQHCAPASRCRTDPNYEPSKIMITDQKAAKLLTDALHKSDVYKSAEDFVCAMDTFYVESFNNVLNIYRDKRISMLDSTYRMRTTLAILHWNKNVDRPYTSVSQPDPNNRDPKSSRQQQGKRNYKQQDFSYTNTIWNRLVDKLYT